MSANSAATFNPKVMLALVLFGAIAFFAALYFIGTGQTSNGNDGGGHAGAKGLNGYAAIAEMLEDEGYDVTLSRSPTGLDEYGLLVLTPPSSMNAEELTQVIEDRRYNGPTVVVLPKWSVSRVPDDWDVESETGWVILAGSNRPYWLEELDGVLTMDGSMSALGKSSPDWRGLGLSGNLPDKTQSLSIVGQAIVPLVKDSNGQTLVGYIDDGGLYPDLAEAAGKNTGVGAAADKEEYGPSSVIIVAEPDLFNNYGMADANRAALALEIVDLSGEYGKLPIVFDLTQSGLGGPQNLLTLALKPPFLAATLCLLIAMLVVGWRAFRRFGPPAAEGRAIAFGKRRLVANSAGLIQRTKRLHLLSGPYADMMRGRITTALGLRQGNDEQIDAALRRRLSDEPPFSQSLSQLRKARTTPELLRAANALRSLERKLSR